MDSPIPFNRIATAGNELSYIGDAMQRQQLAGNGFFTMKCEQWAADKFQAAHTLLTPSCTAALELAALLLEIAPGDEVIVPSYTFVSSVNPFLLRGAKVVFADSCADHPNIDMQQVEQLVTPRTKAVVVTHYGGAACEMETLGALAMKHGFAVVEDAAHAFGAYDKQGRALGTIGDFGAYSFHQTKNITCGEGGMLVFNNSAFAARAGILREKGTNREAFLRGLAGRYEWVDIGSSFLLSELNAAFLYAQLEKFDTLTEKRTTHWNRYFRLLSPVEAKGAARLPHIPAGCRHNAHVFYLVTAAVSERDALIAHLAEKKIAAYFHYLPLHRSPYYSRTGDSRPLPHAEHFGETLLRLPVSSAHTSEEIDRVCEAVLAFYGA